MDDYFSHLIHRHEPPVTWHPIDIIYKGESEWDGLLVINKPASIPAHPSGRYRFNSVVEILKNEHGFPFVSSSQFSDPDINRLDRLTSGVMLLALSPKMAEKLHEKGIKIIGSSFDSMDIAEDRGRFSDLLKEMDIPYPLYGVAESAEEALEVAHKVGYPVLVRPSYVLGGQGMSIVINDEDLEKAVVKLLRNLPGNRVLIDHFLDRAEEAESDSISDGDDCHIIGLMEHIEPAGIHSGDSYAVLPPFNLSKKVTDLMEEYTKRIAKALNVRGLLNIQFAIKDEKVYVIEANPRASRTVPFIAKAYDVPYINIATKIMLGVNKLKDFKIERKLVGYAIKEPVFSFDKFPEVKKELGPEMKSTGESIRFIRDLEDPYFRHLYKEKSMYLSK